MPEAPDKLSDALSASRAVLTFTSPSNICRDFEVVETMVVDVEEGKETSAADVRSMLYSCDKFAYYKEPFEDCLNNTSPYTDAKSFVGTFSANAVDWVWVEIRSDNTAAPAIVDGQSAILLDDGRVVNPDGTTLCFSQTPGPWYVVINHRNHLGVMTNTPVTLN